MNVGDLGVLSQIYSYKVQSCTKREDEFLSSFFHGSIAFNKKNITRGQA